MFLAYDLTFIPLNTDASSFVPPCRLHMTFSIWLPEYVYSFIFKFNIAIIWPLNSVSEVSDSLKDPYNLTDA